MIDARLVPAAVIAWGGSAWLVVAGFQWSLAIVILGLVVAGTWRWLPRLGLIGIVVALLAVSIAWRTWNSDQSVLPEHIGHTVEVEAVVRIDAREFNAWGQSSTVVEVTVHAATINGQRWALRDRAVAFIAAGVGEVSELVVGTRFAGRATLVESDRSDRVVGLRVRSIESSQQSAWWWSASERVRQGVRDAVREIDRPAAALVPALVTGDESAISDQMSDDFRRSGLTHLLAVSGTNLTILLVVVLSMVRWCGGRRWLVVAAAISIIAFVLVARPEPSVQRAAVMGTIAALGLGRGRRAGLRALSVAIIALLVLDPWLSRTPGFNLSVCATAGILVLGGPFTERLERWLPRWAATAVAIPLAAHFACLPAVARLSGEVSLVAIFANVVAAPAVAPATVLGLFGGVVTLLSEPLGQLVALPGVLSAEVIVAAGTWGAALDGAALPWRPPWWVLVAAMPFAMLATGWVVARPVVTIGLCLGLTFAMIRPPQPGWPPDDWVMISCDVGQGAATLIPTGQGEAIVIDVGIETRPIDRCLSAAGVERISALVFTHGDADHVGGWRGAVRGRTVAAVVQGPSGGPPDAEIAAPVIEPEPGDQFTIGETHIEVLWPRGPRGNANDESLVLLIEVAGVSILATGDLGEDAQRVLGALHPHLTADVMTMPHHGSADLWSGLFDLVGPRVVTVSAGADNPYGHPAPSALAELISRGIAFERTDLVGDIVISRTPSGDGSILVGHR